MGWGKRPTSNFRELFGLTTTVGGNEPLNGAVIGSLYLCREDATRQFTISPVILEAFAADTLTTAGLIGASTVCLVVLHFTFSHTHLLTTPFFRVIFDMRS
jgi:hypothetical protein